MRSEIAIAQKEVNLKKYIESSFFKREKYLPKKIRELKAMLLKANCICEQAKGSHTKWSHLLLNYKITLSGKDGNDAKRYQEKDVKDFLKDIKEAQK